MMVDKITMNMISDEIKQMARQAAEDNTYSQIRNQLKDKLKEQFPSSKSSAAKRHKCYARRSRDERIRNSRRNI